MDDQERQDWDRLIGALDAGYLARWDQHDPESLEEEIGPRIATRGEERALQEAWFD